MVFYADLPVYLSTMPSSSSSEPNKSNYGSIVEDNVDHPDEDASLLESEQRETKQDNEDEYEEETTTRITKLTPWIYKPVAILAVVLVVFAVTPISTLCFGGFSVPRQDQRNQLRANLVWTTVLGEDTFSVAGDPPEDDEGDDDDDDLIVTLLMDDDDDLWWILR